VAEHAALDPGERQRVREQAYATLREAGAHRVIDGIADLLPVLEEIDERAGRGGRP
jgi:phosphonoacetaldehyde hydrolase